MRDRYQKIIEQSQEHDFEKYAKLARNSREKMRFLAFAHLKKGKTALQVAELLLTTRQSIYEWMRRFENEGLAGLSEKPGRGRKLCLAVSERDAFKKALLELQEKREGGVIQGKDVLDILKNKFDIKCTQRSVYNHLKKVNLVGDKRSFETSKN